MSEDLKQLGTAHPGHGRQGHRCTPFCPRYTDPPPAATPEAEAFFHAAQKMLSYLWGRWQDEKEYEPIADYALPLKPIAAKAGVEIVKMTSRPFGCRFTVGPKVFTIRVTGREYSYQRVK
jgi:hypothetical protein